MYDNDSVNENIAHEIYQSFAKDDIFQSNKQSLLEENENDNSEFSFKKNLIEANKKHYLNNIQNNNIYDDKEIYPQNDINIKFSGHFLNEPKKIKRISSKQNSKSKNQIKKYSYILRNKIKNIKINKSIKRKDDKENINSNSCHCTKTNSVSINKKNDKTSKNNIKNRISNYQNNVQKKNIFKTKTYSNTKTNIKNNSKNKKQTSISKKNNNLISIHNTINNKICNTPLNNFNQSVNEIKYIYRQNVLNKSLVETIIPNKIVKKRSLLNIRINNTKNNLQKIKSKNNIVNNNTSLCYTEKSYFDIYKNKLNTKKSSKNIYTGKIKLDNDFDIKANIYKRNSFIANTIKNIKGNNDKSTILHKINKSKINNLSKTKSNKSTKLTKKLKKSLRNPIEKRETYASTREISIPNYLGKFLNTIK